MGQEIESSSFTDADMKMFEQQLLNETAILKSYFDKSRFANQDFKAGFELEGWLLDAKSNAAPDNESFLARLNDANVVPELSTFNFEVNGEPLKLKGNAFDQMYKGLLGTWQHCATAASDLNNKIMMIGILPHLPESELNMDNMSHLSRYEALNKQVLIMRNNEPLHLRISGRDEMDLLKYDVMLEAATTSFQIHFQIPLEISANIFNASLICSAPLVAISANSPYLFGKDIWDETRIPLFEQSVEVGDPGQRRVSFGYGYLKESLFECFEENLSYYPALLPLKSEADPELLTHLKFHNGTIWRWNRPLIDFDSDNRPYLRIEHRVVPAGPTILDCIANAAFYYGLSYGLTLQYSDVSSKLPFEKAKSNFYNCARSGLDAPINWINGNILGVRDLILNECLPLAEQGLKSLGLDETSIESWLGIIKARAENRQNGAAWQRGWIAKHGHDLPAMVENYYELQQSEKPVHEWPI